MTFLSGIIIDPKEPARCKQCGFVAGRTHWEHGKRDCFCARCGSIRGVGFCGSGCERLYNDEKDRVLERARRTA